MFAVTRRGGRLVTHGYAVKGKDGRFGGWRTGDCAGVGFAPYAVACDAIAPAIDAAAASAAALEAKAATMEAERPTLPGARSYDWRTHKTTTRPDITPDRSDYATHLAARVREIRGNAAAWREEGRRLEARLAAWRAPATAAE